MISRKRIKACVVVIVGVSVAVMIYRYPSTYAPFELVVLSPEHELDNIVITLFTSKARSH